MSEPRRDDVRIVRDKHLEEFMRKIEGEGLEILQTEVHGQGSESSSYKIVVAPKRPEAKTKGKANAKR